MAHVSHLSSFETVCVQLIAVGARPKNFGSFLAKILDASKMIYMIFVCYHRGKCNQSTWLGSRANVIPSIIYNQTFDLFLVASLSPFILLSFEGFKMWEMNWKIGICVWLDRIYELGESSFHCLFQSIQRGKNYNQEAL